MSRVNSARIAAIKAEHSSLSLEGVVMASDAFFPFRDGLDNAAEVGVRAVIQPGGPCGIKKSSTRPMNMVLPWYLPACGIFGTNRNGILSCSHAPRYSIQGGPRRHHPARI